MFTVPSVVAPRIERVRFELGPRSLQVERSTPDMLRIAFSGDE
ncbi:hypothetical protein [Mesorhizobium retamae]|nr:hypothetical protein [Mesorhizobium sp. IRAMC:0171]